jgi:hypothetical protein
MGSSLSVLGYRLAMILSGGIALIWVDTTQSRWVDLLALLMGMTITLPMATWAALKAKFKTLLNGLNSYFDQPGAGAFLDFIVLYKLGDAFAGSLMTPFLLKAMAWQGANRSDTMGVARI